jgi:hypothetical protein
MWHLIDNMVDRLAWRPPAGAAPAPAPGGQYAVAIRRAGDADAPALHDLAAIDSSPPLEGPVLVAVVDGRIRAALALDGECVIADPFVPTNAAVELLRLRVRQLRAADGRQQRGILPRRVPGRVRT